jgi:thiamine-phosphate pyrophosphorylase
LSSRLPSRLLVITDRGATRGRPLRDVVRAALAGGARLVQLREKDLEGRDLLALAEWLAADCHEVGARLLVNDRVDVALAAGADGVVLPADSLPAEVARRLLGSGALIGRSTHATDEVDRAAREGCDFVLFGPVHPTPSKAGLGPPQGMARLGEASERGIATFAVGGLTATNAAAALGAGAYGVATIREIMSATDPQEAARALCEALGEGGLP